MFGYVWSTNIMERRKSFFKKKTGLSIFTESGFRINPGESIGFFRCASHLKYTALIPLPPTLLV